MKLYFKDNLTDGDKLKFLEYWFDKPNRSGRTLKMIYGYINDGYIYLTDWSEDAIKEVKALNIWKEPRKFGRFWDKSKKDCEYGFMERTISGDCYIYHCFNEYGEEINSCKNFEEITDLKELRSLVLNIN